MLKCIVPAGFMFLLLACGQQAGEKTTAISPDSTTAKQPVADDTLDTVPLGAAKADEYFDKIPVSGLPAAASAAVPVDYTVLDTCTGDLNLDPYPDLLVLLKKKGEDSTSDVVDHPEKRPLLIFVGQPDNTYKLAARSDNAVYCVDCGGMMGDPYQELVIKNGYFSVAHYGGSRDRWARTITFKYAPADSTWYLHKDGHESFDAVDESKSKKTKIYTVKNFGKVAFDQFDVYKDVE